MIFWGFKILESRKIALGKGSIMQHTLFEHKSLFSIIFHKINTIDQVVFHTHAFASIAILLKGGYKESVHNGRFTYKNTVKNLFIPRFLHKNYCHVIQKSKINTWTVVLAGPWQKHWWEYDPKIKIWTKLGWGHAILEVIDDETMELRNWRFDE